MDIEKQVQHWIGGAEEDLAAAQTLIANGHLRFGLFAAHLAVEKALKAHVTRRTQALPPKIHNLIRLAELGSVSLDSTREDELRRLGLYQMAGRYPDFATVIPDAATANARVATAGELVKWLKNLL